MGNLGLLGQIETDSVVARTLQLESVSIYGMI